MQYTRSLGRFIFLLFSLCCFTAAELLATKSHALAINEFSKLFSIHNQTKNSNAHTYEYIDHGTCLSCFFLFGRPKEEKNAYTCITVSIAVTIHLLLISTCMWSRLFKLTACSTLRTLPIPIAIAHALIHYHSLNRPLYVSIVTSSGKNGKSISSRIIDISSHNKHHLYAAWCDGDGDVMCRTNGCRLLRA